MRSAPTCSTVCLCADVPPGELMSHVLREEPVGHSSTVNDLGANHFVHQHCDHLQQPRHGSWGPNSSRKLRLLTCGSLKMNILWMKSHFSITDWQQVFQPSSRRHENWGFYLWVVPPHFINNFEHVQLPLVAVGQGLQDFVKPGGSRCRRGQEVWIHSFN